MVLIHEPEEVPEHQAAGDEFDEGAAQKAGERAQGGLDAVGYGCPVDKNLGQQGAEERPGNHPPRREEDQSGDEPHHGASAGSLAAARKAGEPGRHDVVEHGDEHRDAEPDEQKLQRHLAVAEKKEQQQGAPTERWPGYHGQKASDDARQCQEYRYDVYDHLVII